LGNTIYEDIEIEEDFAEEILGRILQNLTTAKEKLRYLLPDSPTLDIVIIGGWCNYPKMKKMVRSTFSDWTGKLLFGADGREVVARAATFPIRGNTFFNSKGAQILLEVVDIVRPNHVSMIGFFQMAMDYFKLRVRCNII